MQAYIAFLLDRRDAERKKAKRLEPALRKRA
jgi:hypothetical protein